MVALTDESMAATAARDLLQSHPDAARLLLAAGAQWSVEDAMSDPAALILDGVNDLRDSQAVSAQAKHALGLATDVAVEILSGLLTKVVG